MRSTNTASLAWRHNVPNIAVLFTAIFLIACAEELWARFVPEYLRALGATVAIVAGYGTLKDFLDAVYQFPGGLLVNRLGYKRALVGFNAVAIAGYLAFAFAGSWIVVLAALPLVMAWQSFSLPATFSMIGDVLPQAGGAWRSRINRSYAVFRSCWPRLPAVSSSRALERSPVCASRFWPASRSPF